MANEIKYGMQMSLTNGLLTDTFSKTGLSTNQVSNRLVRNVQEIGIGGAGDALNFGDVINPGLALFINLDLVNWIDIGIGVDGTFWPFIHLLAGQHSGPLLLGTGIGTSVYALANTAPAKLFYIVYDR
jgi:hypothetical protein